MAPKKMTIAVIIGNRGSFPDQLAKTGREEMIETLTAAGMDSVVLSYLAWPMYWHGNWRRLGASCEASCKNVRVSR
jgi:hypothetical protein